MTGVVDSSTIEQYQILGRRTATHLITTGTVALALHARQQLDALNDILLAKQCRHTSQSGYLKLLDAYLHLVDTLLGRTRRYSNLA